VSRALFLILILLCAAARSETKDEKVKALDSSFGYLGDGYPQSRILGGSVSMFNGATAFFGGIFLFSDKIRSNDEAMISIAGSTLGALQFIDGFVRAFGRSSSEYLLTHYQSFPKSGRPKEYGGELDRAEYGELNLKMLAEEAKSARLARGVSDLLLSAGYAYLFFKGERKTLVDSAGTPYLVGNNAYPKLLFPALFVGATGLYRIFFSSREERARDRFREGIGNRQADSPSVDFVALPLPSGPYLGINIVF